MGAPVVECRGVSKRFGERCAVDGVDLEVPAGQCFGLLGPNGAGKTTTLRMIYGVTAPTRGSVRVFGLDVTRHPREVRARLGVTLQENAFIEVLSPVENLRVFGRYHRLSGAALEERIEELLDFLELRSHASLPVAALSGGFKRRLAVALSLVNRPELIVLDEPTTGLDPAVRLALWQRVRELRAAGSTVLLTTHYMEEAEVLCDRIAIMDHGRILEIGTVRELVDSRFRERAVHFDRFDGLSDGQLGAFPGVSSVKHEDGEVVLFTADVAGTIGAVLAAADEIGAEPQNLAIRRATLEDVFLDLTGRALRD
jgi:lipooligosaccharide transport system ATP-binding protein